MDLNPVTKKKKRMKNLTFVDECPNEKIEEKFRRDQHKKFSDS
jgi:hypothetical protein